MRAQSVVLLGHRAKLESVDPEQACRPPGVARLGDILAKVPQAVNGINCNRCGPFAFSQPEVLAD